MTAPTVPLTIAAVEDRDELRAAAVELLRSRGHRVACLNSAEAPDLSVTPPPDVFMIDLRLPGEDGLGLAEQVRAVHPRAGIVMVSAGTGAGASDRSDGRARGAHLYLLEPLTPQGLLAAIHAIAERSPAATATPAQTASHNLAAPPAQPPAAEPLLLALALDTTQLSLTGPLGTVGLTPAEAALVAALARAPRRQLGMARIAEALEVPLQHLSKASLQVRMVRLRRKLGAAGAGAQAIKAVRGYGYQLCALVLLRG